VLAFAVPVDAADRRERRHRVPEARPPARADLLRARRTGRRRAPARRPRPTTSWARFRSRGGSRRRGGALRITDVAFDIRRDLSWTPSRHRGADRALRATHSARERWCRACTPTPASTRPHRRRCPARVRGPCAVGRRPPTSPAALRVRGRTRPTTRRPSPSSPASEARVVASVAPLRGDAASCRSATSHRRRTAAASRRRSTPILGTGKPRAESGGYHLGNAPFMWELRTRPSLSSLRAPSPRPRGPPATARAACARGTGGSAAGPGDGRRRRGAQRRRRRRLSLGRMTCIPSEAAVADVPVEPG